MKAKTKKSLRKRVKITKTGKLLRRRCGKSHLLSSKSKKRKRSLRRPTLLGAVDKKSLKKALPYS